MRQKTANSKTSVDCKPFKTNDLVVYVQTSLKNLADQEKALEMAAYMKTDMPFYGVQKPAREQIIKEIKTNFAPTTQADYEAAILALWRQPRREEKYIALNYASLFRQFVTPVSLPLYERLIREGQWWDFVDPLASDLVGKTLLNYESETRTVIESFAGDDDFWIRRTALLAHLSHKKETSHKHLFAYCKAMAHEKEFFIRKAIGWALREYSKSEPERVLKFLNQNKTKLSPLSLREGAKHLIKTGQASNLFD